MSDEKVVLIEEEVQKEKEEKKDGLYLFGKVYSYFNDIPISTKYLVYIIWKQKYNSKTLTDEVMQESLEELDWLKFDWSKLPKTIFVNLFERISHCRLTFLIGYFCRDYFESVDETKSKQMINILWEHFQSK